MSFNQTIEDWKNQNNDPLGHWLSKLDKDQIKLMEEVKKRFNSRVDGFRELKIEELRSKFDLHISYDAKRQFLNRHHAQIIDKENFIPRYRSIINTDDYGLMNEEMYPEFIYSFGVIGLSSPYVFEENEMRAMEYLEDVATLNIIERMLMVLKEEEIKGNTRFSDLPEWKKVLLKLGNRFEYKKNKFPTAKFTIIHIWMNDNKSFLDGIIFKEYRKFVITNFKEEFKKSEFKALDKNIDRKSDQYKNNKEELTNIYNNKS